MSITILQLQTNANQDAAVIVTQIPGHSGKASLPQQEYTTTTYITLSTKMCHNNWVKYAQSFFLAMSM